MTNLEKTGFDPENLELEEKVNSSFPKKEIEKRLTPENVTKQKYKDLLIAEKKEDQALEEIDRLQKEMNNIFANIPNRKKAEKKIVEEIDPLMNKAMEEVDLIKDESNKAYDEWSNAMKEEFEELAKRNEEDDKENE